MIQRAQNVTRSIAQAFEAGDFAALETLFTAHPESLGFNGSLGTWLHVAARAGDLRMMEFLVQRGIPVDVLRSGTPETPLHLAAVAGQAAAADWLLAHGADPNGAPGSWQPVLAAAVYGDSLPIVQRLVERGAVVNSIYGDPPRTSLDAAHSRGRQSIVEWLEATTDAKRYAELLAQAPMASSLANSLALEWLESRFEHVERIVGPDPGVGLLLAYQTSGQSSVLVTSGTAELKGTSGLCVELAINLSGDWPALPTSDPWRSAVLLTICGIRRHLESDRELLDEKSVLVKLSAPMGNFTSALLLPRFRDRNVGAEGRALTVLDIVPIYEREREWERSNGVHELLKRFSESGISPIVTADRPEVGLH